MEKLSTTGKISKKSKSTMSASNGDSQDGAPPTVPLPLPTREEVEICTENCEVCLGYKTHKELFKLSLKTYTEDKEKASLDKSVLILSGDLEKVVLLPRLPGYKI